MFAGFCSKASCNRMCERPAGDIPKTKKFAYQVPCHLRHPGLCKSRDSGSYRDALAIAKGMHKHCSEEGSWFEIRGLRYVDVELDLFEVVHCQRLYCASVRLADPKITVYVKCDDAVLEDGRSCLRMREVGGIFSFCTAWGIAAD